MIEIRIDEVLAADPQGRLLPLEALILADERVDEVVSNLFKENDKISYFILKVVRK